MILAAMATRLNKRQQESTRLKIKTSQLINRLQKHALGKVDMNASQIRAAEVCLKKALPDLQSTEHSGEIGLTNANELTDSQLAAIAAGSSAGTTEQTGSEEEPSSVH